MGLINSRQRDDAGVSDNHEREDDMQSELVGVVAGKPATPPGSSTWWPGGFRFQIKPGGGGVMLSLKQARRMVAKARKRVWAALRRREPTLARLVAAWSAAQHAERAVAAYRWRGRVEQITESIDLAEVA